MKWINTLTPWLLNHVFLNVWIMVCSELVAHDPWNASLQRPNQHIGWGQSLLILTACAWNEERPSLLFLSRSEISTSLEIPFWAWIIFLSWKKSRLGSHLTLGGQEKISIRKEKMPWESQKGIKSPRNSNARGHAQITRKSDSQNNDKGQIKEERQKKMWMTSRVKLLIVILGLWNPETLFEPYESFSFITKNHSLRYVPI